MGAGEKCHLSFSSLLVPRAMAWICCLSKHACDFPTQLRLCEAFEISKHHKVTR